jgi:hypothetical protein
MFGEEGKYKECEIALFNDMVLLLQRLAGKYRALSPPLYLKAIVVKPSEVCEILTLAFDY